MDFLSIFFRHFYRGYFPTDASWFFLHIITILIVVGIVFKFKKNHFLSKKIFNVILILGIMGTLYGVTLILKALGQPAIPLDDTPYLLFNGLGCAIQPLVLAFFGWLIVSAMDIFLSREK